MPAVVPSILNFVNSFTKMISKAKLPAARRPVVMQIIFAQGLSEGSVTIYPFKITTVGSAALKKLITKTPMMIMVKPVPCRKLILSL